MQKVVLGIGKKGEESNMIIEYKDSVPDYGPPHGFVFSSPVMELTVERGDNVKLNSVEMGVGVWRLRSAQVMEALNRDSKVSMFFDFFARRISWERFEVVANWRGRESFVKVNYDDGLSYRMEKHRARPWWRKRSVREAKEVRPRKFRP